MYRYRCRSKDPNRLMIVESSTGFGADAMSGGDFRDVREQAENSFASHSLRDGGT